MRWLLFGVLLGTQASSAALAPPPPAALEVRLSVAHSSVTFPFALPVTLEFHNLSSKTLWLYRPVRASLQSDNFTSLEQAAQETRGGSTLSIILTPADERRAIKFQSPARGAVLAPAELPQPRLVRLAPGGDTEETALLQLAPAVEPASGGPQPFWGSYTLAVTYGAQFSNSSELARNLGVELWTGTAQSNSVSIELRAPQGQASIAGTVMDANAAPLPEALVSLCDRELHLLNQKRADDQGRFAFAGLPPGFYWVIVRPAHATEANSVVRHFVISGGEGASAQLMLSPPDINEPKQVLHKPVLFRVVDRHHRPRADVTLKILSAQEPVVENLSAHSDDDGLANVELIPGAVYVTLERPGCPKEDLRLEVESGGGVDGFAIESDCTRQQ